MRTTARILALLLAGTTALLAAGCSREQEDGFQFDITETEEDFFDSEYETIMSVEETAATSVTVNTAANVSETKAVLPDSDHVYGFRSAVWLAKDLTEDTERYFCFYDDKNGVMLDQQSGQGVGFTCELGQTDGVFRFGENGQQSRVSISWTTDDSGVVKWEDGKAEVFTFLRENGAQELRFYSNEQLCALSLDYYERVNHYRPGMASAMININETVSVHLYDVEGDHISTCDWYTFDRYTGVGYNIANDTVNLAAPAAETAPGETVPAETVPETQPGQEIPAEEVPVEEVPAEEVPAEEVPAEEVPAV